MSRIRSIHPGTATDEAYMSMSMAAKAAWPLLWTESDDHGVFEWKPIVLKARIFPADNVDFGALLDEYVKLGCVMLAEIEGKIYGVIRNFCKFQRPQKPSYKYPTTAEVLDYVGFKSSESDTPTIPVSNQSGTDTGKPPLMKEEGGKMEEVRKELSNESLSNAIEIWNRLAGETGLPKAQNPSPTRLKALHFRLQEIGGIEGWSALMEQIRGSPHLLGQNDRGWRASFDWILKPANLTKVMEGNYLATDRSNSNGSQRPNSISDSLDAVIVAFDRGIAERQGNSAAVAPDAGNVSRFQQSYAAYHGGGDREAG